jgi:beta-lactamase superfamily II metal-dependent hydrolase
MTRARIALHGLSLAALLLPGGTALATPPAYQSFGREQTTSRTIDPAKLLRIWIIYIGQGDSILIQIPEALSAGGKRDDVLVDGGPNGAQLQTFLTHLYGAACCEIENVVLTHHDNDHVAGLTALANNNKVGISRVFHNGLASYRPNMRGFGGLDPGDTDRAMFSIKDGHIDRGMAFYDADAFTLTPTFLVRDVDAMRLAFAANDFEGIYEDFARSLTAKTLPHPVQRVDFCPRGSNVLPQFPSTGGAAAVALEPIWPRANPRKYGSNWAYTINGNSVTFKLVYADFEMLFTGDHNDASEQDLLDLLPDDSVLAADVLKVPHHGSQHSLQPFFDAVHPVVSVASMGRQGFETGWKHPSEEVIRWAGGSHRIYHTYIHERPFHYADLSATEKVAMRETTHILVETDGAWFRVVELDDPAHIPAIAAVARGNGTRWIKASP